MSESGMANTANIENDKPASLVFFRRWLAHPLAVGSLVPSSAWLGKLIARHVICEPDEIVVELGAGTGAVTRALLDTGFPPERLWAVEIDQALAAYLRAAFPRIRVIEGDARHLESLIAAEHRGKVGTVILGIPMVTLAPALQRQIIDAIFRVMPEGRRALHYTFRATSPLARDALGLTGERLAWTARNLPPASVWGYRFAPAPES